jgi:hypothetical protein
MEAIFGLRPWKSKQDILDELAVEADAAKADAAQAAVTEGTESAAPVPSTDAPEVVMPNKDSTDLDSDRDPIG